jgi:HD-like signal output (HDOD) protein
MTLFTDLFQQCKALPVAPTLLRDLIDSFNDDNASVHDLATLMERDPALCAQLLRLANSAYFQLPEPVSTTTQALQHVGLTNARSLAISLGLMSCFARVPASALHSLWQHSLRTAIAASHWSSATEHSPSIAYTVGLLRSVGQLVMQIGIPQPMELVDAVVERHSPLRAAAEKARWGYAYTDVGAELCRQWRLPALYSDAIAASAGDLSPAEQSPLAALVQIAAWQAWSDSQTLSPSELEALWPAAAAERVGIDFAQAGPNFPDWKQAGGPAAALLTPA